MSVHNEMNKIIERASLICQVVEDLTYEALSPQRYEAELVDTRKSPEYKNGGYFVFSNLSTGDYTLRISGECFQPQIHALTIPITTPVFGSPPASLQYPIFDTPGDNELIVIVDSVNGGGNRIIFDEVTLNKEIRAGSSVVASGFLASLVETLDAGKVSQAKVDDVTGLAQGSLVRIIRDRSIRLKFDPYYLFPTKLTIIAGKVVPQNAPEMPLAGAQVRLTKVSSNDVTLIDVAGAKIATVGAGVNSVVLGAYKDVVTFTNERGDYNFYFDNGKLEVDATLEVSFAGYQTQTKTIAITELARNRVDFELVGS